jgi:hypothetical protein
MVAGDMLTHNTSKVYNYLELLYYEVEMDAVTDIKDFKARKLAKLEDEFAMYMDRADKFSKEGKTLFARQMLDKAKALRPEIDKLRAPVKRPVPQRFLTGPTNPTHVRQGLLPPGTQWNQQWTAMTPEPENN